MPHVRIDLRRLAELAGLDTSAIEDEDLYKRLAERLRTHPELSAEELLGAMRVAAN
jgi:hypothetical protein